MYKQTAGMPFWLQMLIVLGVSSDYSNMETSIFQGLLSE